MKNPKKIGKRNNKKKEITAGQLADTILKHCHEHFVRKEEYGKHKTELVQKVIRTERFVTEESAAFSRLLDSQHALLVVMSELAEIPYEKVFKTFQKALADTVAISKEGKVHGEVEVLEFNYEGGAK